MILVICLPFGEVEFTETVSVIFWGRVDANPFSCFSWLNN